MSRQEQSRCAPPVKVGLASEVAALIREHATDPVPEPLFDGYATDAPPIPRESVTYRVYFTALNNTMPAVGVYSTWGGVVQRVRMSRRLNQSVQRVERVQVQVSVEELPIPN